MGRRVVDSFGRPSSRVSASVYVRRWDEGLLGASLGLLGGYGLTAWLTWHNLPVLGPAPYGDALHHVFVDWPHVLAAPWSERAGAYWDAYRWGGILRCGLSALVGVGLGGVFGWSGLKPRNNVKWISGPQLLKGDEAKQEARRITRREQAKGKPAWMQIHPLLGLAKRTFHRHLFLVGAPGSGKTQILLGLLDQVYAQNRKALIYDVKGDFTAAYLGLLVSPWDARSAAWDIGYDLSTRNAASDFAASIIPTESGAGKYWSDAAQMLLTGCIRALQDEKGRAWGWKDLAERLRLDQGAFVESLRGSYDKAVPLIADPKSTATSSALATLSASTRVIDQLAEAWGDASPDTPRVRLTAWAKDGYKGERQIIVQGGPDAQLSNAYISAMVNVCAATVLSPAMPDSATRTLFFILDELASLRVHLPPLIDKGRSKGVIVVGALQTLEQLEPLYGPAIAKSLVSMVGTRVVCQTQPGDTQVKLAELFGKKKVAITETDSNGYTKTREENKPVVKPNVLTAELGPQHRGNAFHVRAIVQVAAHDPLVLDWPGVVKPTLRDSFLAADWVRTVRAKDKKAPAECTAVLPGEPAGGSAGGMAPERMPGEDSKDHQAVGEIFAQWVALKGEDGR